MDWVSARLAEPSTWAGIITLASGALHVTVSGDMIQALTTAGMAVGGLLAVVMKERASA